MKMINEWEFVYHTWKKENAIKNTFLHGVIRENSSQIIYLQIVNIMKYKMKAEMCSRCEEYKKEGHNYCRMCGYHLTKGYAQYAKLAIAYFSDEKYCGYCGGIKNKCNCINQVKNCKL